MLDQLRRHAKSWVVKGVLALIVLTFIFFFGYSQLASRSQDQQRLAARVGSEGIPRRQMEAYFQSSLDRMKEGFQSGVPENIEKFLRRSVMEQMVSRELMVQYARELGMTVSDQEIAEAIRSDKGLFPDGHFDVVSYRDRFLPYYRQRYGQDFETVMARSLFVEKIQAFLPVLFDPWKEELELSRKTVEKKVPKKAKKKGKDKTQETQHASSLTPENLFSPWLEEFKNKVKVEVFNP